MDLVINISECTYKAKQRLVANQKRMIDEVDIAIANGTPLPKGKSLLVIDTPNTCADCPLCIYTAEEKKHIGYCNTSDEDYYCKALERFMEYDEVNGGVDILGKPIDCPLQAESEEV